MFLNEKRRQVKLLRMWHQLLENLNVFDCMQAEETDWHV